MSFIFDLLADIGSAIRPYNSDIALAFVASLLVIIGGDINRHIRNLISNAHFLIRTIIFILVCTFGYGFLTLFLTGIITKQLSAIPLVYLALVVFSSFILLGVYAERKRHI